MRLRPELGGVLLVRARLVPASSRLSHTNSRLVVETLPEPARAALDAGPVRPIVEYLLDRLGCAEGHWRIDVEARDGRFRRGALRRGPFGADELERFGVRSAPRTALRPSALCDL